MKATKVDRQTRRDNRRRDPEWRLPDRHDRAAHGTGRRSAEPLPRTGRAPRAKGAKAREKRPAGSGPKTTPIRKQARPTSTTQAKARAKARKAKAPKVVKPPLRERLIARLASVDLRPHTIAAKVPFVVLVIGSLGLGLGATLWLSTYSAERSYELGNARETDRALSQQKEALERNVLEAQSAPALAEAARNLGMIPSRDTAHLVQDPSGNWIVVGKPKPAEGAPPPPLNTPLPDPTPPPPPVNHTEVPVRISPPAAALAAPAAPGAVAPGATPPAVLPGAVAPGATPPALVPGATGAAVSAPQAPGATEPALVPAPQAPGATGLAAPAPETPVRVPSPDAVDGSAPTAPVAVVPAPVAVAPAPVAVAPAPVAAPPAPDATAPMGGAAPADAPQAANPPTAPPGGEQFNGVGSPIPAPPT